tara:strand:- start:5898 stop:6734 length:837 start_codon:yes stop_codon:yes gene_type:complete
MCDMEPIRTFDRTKDVSKIVGLNSRGVEFRWSLFLDNIGKVAGGAPVLDFGAGSLRESYELVLRGFEVTSFDLDEATLRSYYKDYDWSGVAHEPVIVSGDVGCLRDKHFALITAFDVLEHLEDPMELLSAFLDTLDEEGLFFCSVPNCLSAWEIGRRISWKLGLALGGVFRPGEPHIQFKTPGQWRRYFEEQAGLEVVAHEMGIGFFVNSWDAITGVPVRVVRKLGKRLFGLDDARFGRGVLAGAAVMAALHRLDRLTEKFLHPLYGSCLFVLKKRSP